VQHQKNPIIRTSEYTFGWVLWALAKGICQENCVSQFRGQGCVSCNSCLAYEAAGSWHSPEAAVGKVVHMARSPSGLSPKYRCILQVSSNPRRQPAPGGTSVRVRARRGEMCFRRKQRCHL